MIVIVIIVIIIIIILIIMEASGWPSQAAIRAVRQAQACGQGPGRLGAASPKGRALGVLLLAG